jgi:uncharacterized linocin/CFP29 family protein
MDFLKRQLAPLTDEAWAEINDEAKRVLCTHLSARRVVDVEGPHGLDFAAVGIGRLDVPKQPKDAPVQFGIHNVQPLVEVRAEFEVGQWELDNIARGAADVDLADLHRAAGEMAAFEERAVYGGFKPGNIVGLSAACEHDPVVLPSDTEQYPAAISEAMIRLAEAHVDGPFTLVLGPDTYRALYSAVSGYPLPRKISEMIGGGVELAPKLTGGFLVSKRGGDMVLTLGQDISIGYISHDTKSVRLYLTESFTFRVLAPEAYIGLELQA